MKKNDGEPAFPRPTGNNGLPHHEEHESNGAQAGMSLRDWFAGQALAALHWHGVGGVDAVNHAVACYELADAMLAERAK